MHKVIILLLNIKSHFANNIIVQNGLDITYIYIYKLIFS